MPWPVDDISTAGVDSGTDTPPRAEFFKVFQRLKAVIAGRGAADGVASLDARRRVPDAELGRAVAGGVAALDGSGRVPQAQIPEQPQPVLWRPGDLKAHAGGAVEEGWLLADGSEASRAGDAALFAAIGTRWGAGDGATTFNLPDYTDRMILGASATRPVGTAGGAAEHTLTVAEIPPAKIRGRGFSNSAVGVEDALVTAHAGDPTQFFTSPGTRTLGGGGPHNNMPPFAAALVLIKR